MLSFFTKICFPLKVIPMKNARKKTQFEVLFTHDIGAPQVTQDGYIYASGATISTSLGTLRSASALRINITNAEMIFIINASGAAIFKGIVVPFIFETAADATISWGEKNASASLSTAIDACSDKDIRYRLGKSYPLNGKYWYYNGTSTYLADATRTFTMQMTDLCKRWLNTAQSPRMLASNDTYLCAGILYKPRTNNIETVSVTAFLRVAYDYTQQANL